MDTILILSLIAALGYLLGAVKIGGMRLGTSAVLLVALVFGHFGAEIPAAVKNLGLAMFVGSVGFIAGPHFFRNFKQKVFSYLILGVLIIVIAAVCTYVLGKLLNIPAALSVGVLNGALTSTPGLAAASEVTKDTITTVGYGVAYPFGVVGVVLFVQLLPRLLKADIPAEVELMNQSLCIPGEQAGAKDAAQGKREKNLGMSLLTFFAALVLGLLLGKLRIPLPGGMSFSLGISGGPLFAGIIVGYLTGRRESAVGVSGSTLNVLRELGLMLFLLSAGVSAGNGFIDTVAQYGVMLFVFGAVITLVPMCLAYLIASKLMKARMFNALGSICGGMTSTPALGMLISTAGTENVAVAYAATYPFALVFIVIISQILPMIW